MADEPTIVSASDLGKRVRAKRRSEGLSIRRAAEVTGVSAPTLSRVERGDHLPERDNLLRLARWAGVLIDAPDDLRAARNQAVHHPKASTLEAVELHLRADPKLSRKDADALSEMFRIAYQHLAVNAEPARARKREL